MAPAHEASRFGGQCGGGWEDDDEVPGAGREGVEGGPVAGRWRGDPGIDDLAGERNAVCRLPASRGSTWGTPTSGVAEGGGSETFLTILDAFKARADRSPKRK